MDTLWDIIIKGVGQAPLAAGFAFLWWTSRKDYLIALKRLDDEQKRKDETIAKFIVALDSMRLTLELIKDRLRNV